MPTIFPTAPHFDDFDQTKQFVRILFRPGRAVQARELTQLQTIIQSQIERFGKGIYKDGSFITPPETTFDNVFSFVKLTETTGGTTSDDVLPGLVGEEITNTDGVKALIVNHAISTTAGDPPTLFIKYTDGGTNKALSFSNGDTLTSGSTTLTAASSGAVGNGTAFSIGESIVFAKGNFLFVNKQTEILSKYGSVDNTLIGLNITESVVNTDTDESLLDPATGTFNFFAPGADRYKANLILGSKELDFSSNADPNFVEIARVQAGRVISLKENPEFSALGDAIARRTYDESGHYVVEQFNIELFEHLRTSSTANSIAEVGSTRDGIYTAANGGDANIFVAKIGTGKAFVKGYEVDNFNSIYLSIPKARNNTDTIASIVPTSLSSFVKITDVDSIPEFEDIITLSLKDQFKSGNLAVNGNEIGTAKARGLIYLTGNVAAARGGGEDRTAQFELHLFDINMVSGNEFERDVKQITSTNSYTNFSANIVSAPKTLSGAVTFNNASTTVRGSGTRFSTELKVGDTFNVSNTQTTNKLVVASITDESTLTTTAAPSINLQQAVEVTYNTFNRDQALINNADKDLLVFKLPADNIRNVDDSVVTYSVKRQFTGITLSSGAHTFSALNAGENFAPFSTDNYAAVITSGARNGELIPLQSSQFSRDTSARTATFDFSTTESLNSETVTIYTTITKGAGAGSRLKTKTLTENSTIDIIDQDKAQASIISLGKADGFRLKSVLMSNVDTQFGSAVNVAGLEGSSNITARYTFDNGQKSSFYDVAKIKLKPGQAKPQHPIRVTFDFFTHSNSGDYFDVSSYSGLNYEDIPSTTLNGKKFELRDCIDFRPRINDAGTGFTGTGAPTNQPLFLDPEIDFTLNFRHYLPKISTIGLDVNGNFILYDGVSQLQPTEPDFPGDLVKLFVLDQEAYVFNIIDGIKIKVIQNQRFTMKDIGKIEDRVKTLEYYTSLNLLERDAQSVQIQDSLGFERFKNGFLVDSFTGHGVGDSIDNPDYAAAVNFKKREAGPLTKTEFLYFDELNRFNYGGDFSSSTSRRTSNNYVASGDVLSLPFTEEILIQNTFSSRTNNLNPFNLGVFQGLAILSPPGDIFFEDRRQPTIEVDNLGNYDSLSSRTLIKADGKNIFGSIADIEQFNSGTVINSDQLPSFLKSLADVVGALSPNTTSVNVTGNECVKVTNIVPKMRDISIRFNVSGLRPNTTIFAYFDDLNVSSFCTLDTTATIEAGDRITANANITNFANLANAQLASANALLTTDATGSFSGVFNYNSKSLNLDVGKKLLRFTNSPSGNKDGEVTFAETTFFSDGLVRDIFNEVLRPPPPPQIIEKIVEVQVGDVNGPDGETPDKEPPVTVLEIVWRVAIAQNPGSGDYDLWVGRYPQLGRDANDDVFLVSKAHRKNIYKGIGHIVDSMMKNVERRKDPPTYDGTMIARGVAQVSNSRNYSGYSSWSNRGIIHRNMTRGIFNEVPGIKRSGILWPDNEAILY